MTERNYNYRDVDMLMAAKSVAAGLTTNLQELSMVRTTWNEAYATELKTRIDSAIENYLGLDKVKSQRDATNLLKSIEAPARRNLAFLKTQIEVDFGAQAPEILKSLGYKGQLRATDQEGLIEHLYAFKKGMADGLKTQIMDKGTNPVLIDSLIGYASELEQANLDQESLKMNTRQLSEEAVSAFNGIYTEVIGICKIASKFYASEPVKKQQFTFSQVVKKLGAANKKEEEPVEE